MKLKSCSLALLLMLDAQSLVEIAREEAERRQAIDQQGIVAKVIDSSTIPQVQNSNVTTSTVSEMSSREASEKSSSTKGKTSVRNYRSTLQKLDREIRQNEARLVLKRSRLQSEKWSNPVSGKASNANRSGMMQSQLQAEIDELQARLKQLRNERFETYEAGKRAGFLPGELEGRGLTP